MYFLGIDQSLRSTGVAVLSQEKVEYTGTVTPKKLTGVSRLAFIRDALWEILVRFPNVSFAALEGYAYDVGAGRVFELGEAGGMVQLVLHDSVIPFVVVPPASLKQFVSGNGASDKEAMSAAVFSKWKIKIKQNDECDAFGLAQVAKAMYLNKGSTRAELEVLKSLRDKEKSISLVSYGKSVISI